VLILDAGTGIRLLGATLPSSLKRVDVLLTHLHMDHVLGLGFFSPLYDPEVEVHIWGPASATLGLRDRIARYLSPPLFPVRLRDFPHTLFHEVPRKDFKIGGFQISSMLVCHPNPTVGYRISNSSASLAYLPDHEPALGVRKFPQSGDWTSGYALAAGVDLLIHDAQYDDLEYASSIGWGHSSLTQAFEFADLADVKRLVPFHHDPWHSDDHLDRLITEAMTSGNPRFAVTPGMEGATFNYAG
jgi:ribonuclease BN (tRNA processing enzyme)